MQSIITVAGVAGNFNVRVVYQGDSYGLDNCLTHEESEPLVEFYDARYMHTELGQFVSRYYIGTLLEGNDGVGLCLHGGVDSWQIAAEGMDRVRAVLREISDMDDEPEYEEPWLDAVEADADVLASAGMGTDEDYGYFGDDY